MERRPPSRPRSEDLERKKIREKECVKHVAKTKIDVPVSLFAVPIPSIPTWSCARICWRASAGTAAVTPFASLPRLLPWARPPPSPLRPPGNPARRSQGDPWRIRKQKRDERGLEEAGANVTLINLATFGLF